MILRLQRLRQIRSYTIVRKNMRGEKLRQSEEEEREEELDFESESDWEQDYPEKVFKKLLNMRLNMNMNKFMLIEKFVVDTCG